jgi:hypothetical protein
MVSSGVPVTFAAGILHSMKIKRFALLSSVFCFVLQAAAADIIPL